MPPRTRRPVGKKAPNPPDDTIDLDDIEDPDDVPQSPQFRPTPRFTIPQSAKRAPASKTQTPVQPESRKPPASVPSNKSTRSSRFLDDIDPDLIAASLNPSTPAVKGKDRKKRERKKNIPVTESSRLRSTPLGFSTSTPGQAQTTRHQASKPPLFSSRNTGGPAKAPHYQNRQELELEPSSASANRTSRSHLVPSLEAEAATPTPVLGARFRKPPLSSTRDNSAKASRFQDEIDPDLLALVSPASKNRIRIDLNAVLAPIPWAPIGIEDDLDPPLVTTRSRQMRTQESVNQAPTTIASQDPKGSSLQKTALSSTTTPRLQNILDLTASLSSSANKQPTVSESSAVEPPKASKRKRKAAETLARLVKGAASNVPPNNASEAAPHAPIQASEGLQYDKPRSNIAVVIPMRSVSLSKRPRVRSSSPPDFVPDTPPPKRQQQEDQRHANTAALIPSSPPIDDAKAVVIADSKDEDEIERSESESESPAGLVQRSKSLPKRQILEIDSSPTTQKVKQPRLRKRQKILAEEVEDEIEDDSDSPLFPVKKPWAPPLIKPKRIEDSSSGDEVAEDIDAIDRKALLDALAPPPTEILTRPGEPGSRRIMNPDAMRRHFRNTKPIPKPPSPLKPGMINVLTHYKNLVIPRDPTPPPPSPPRRGYVQHGLAETAMWWKHDSKELAKRTVFTDQLPKLTFRIVVKEFLRDGEMCVVKGLGENKDGKEGVVRAIVTERTAGAITRKGLTLFYDRPWFPVRLFGEAEPYRFLVGRWEVRDVGTEKAKKGEKTKKTGRAEKIEKSRKGKEKENTEETGQTEEAEIVIGMGKVEKSKKIQNARKDIEKAGETEEAEKAGRMETIRRAEKAERIEKTKGAAEPGQTEKVRGTKKGKEKEIIKETEQTGQTEKPKTKKMKRAEETEKAEKALTQKVKLKKSKKSKKAEETQETGKLRTERVRTENMEKSKETEKTEKAREMGEAGKAETKARGIMEMEEVGKLKKPRSAKKARKDIGNPRETETADMLKESRRAGEAGNVEIAEGTEETKKAKQADTSMEKMEKLESLGKVEKMAKAKKAKKIEKDDEITAVEKAKKGKEIKKSNEEEKTEIGETAQKGKDTEKTRKPKNKGREKAKEAKSKKLIPE